MLRVEGTFAAGQAVRVCVIRGRTGNSERRKARAASPREGEEAEEEALTQGIEKLDVGAAAQKEGNEEEKEEILEFGRGLTNYNSIEIDRVKGLRRCVFPLPFLSSLLMHSPWAALTDTLACQLRHRAGPVALRRRARRREHRRAPACGRQGSVAS